MSQKEICGSGGFVWSREMTATLIHLYEENPALYKVKAANYHNKNTRQAILQQITRDVNETHMTNLTVADISKKIHGLRTNYFQEVNKMKKSEKSGASTGDLHVPKWWCFEMLHFLRDHSVVIHEGTSNMPTTSRGEEESENVGDIIFEGSTSDLEVSSPFSPLSTESGSKGPTRLNSGESILPKKRKASDSDIGTLLSSATSALQKIQEGRVETTNRHTIFGQIIAFEMENIKDEAILDEFKENVMAALFQAKRKQREEN